MPYCKTIALYLGLSMGVSGGLYAADGDIRASGKLVSDVAAGQPPLVVNSTTAVPNLNADMLDGMHASDFALQSDGYISIPLGSLILGGTAIFDSDGNVFGLTLTENLSSVFSSNLVIPDDYTPGTDILIDLSVTNPAGSSACLAIISTSFARGFRPGSSSTFFPLFGFAPAFPVFSSGDYAITHRYILRTVQAGDSILFGWWRQGSHADDICGDLHLVGINVRYQKQ